MFDFLKDEPQRVTVVGDVMVNPATMEEAVRASSLNVESVSTCFWGSESRDEFASRQLNLERRGPDAEACAPGLPEAMAGTTVLMTHFNPVSRSLIEQGPDLKAILTCRGGMEHIDVAAATEHGIPVINVIRNAVPVAEFALGLMLAVTRNIASSHAALSQGRWVKGFPNAAHVTTLDGLTVGLAGLGNIGIELTTRLKALGVALIAYEPYPDVARLERRGLSDIRMVDSLEDLFSQADIVSMHLRLTPENEGVVDRRLLSLMKPSAYFVNTARGGLVNHGDLAETLREHRIAGAALDVFDSEPLVEGSPLYGLDNLVMTPHIAGQTVDAIPRSPFMLMREVDRMLAQGSAERIVNAHELGLA